LPLVEFVGEIGAICFHSGLGRLGFNFVQLLCALIVRFVMCRYEVRRGRVQCPCVASPELRSNYESRVDPFDYWHLYMYRFRDQGPRRASGTRSKKKTLDSPHSSFYRRFSTWIFPISVYGVFEHPWRRNAQKCGLKKSRGG
jgi:hypothetical protein